MEIKTVFRGISAKLLADFTISGEIQHSGSKGSFREHSLRDFLSAHRLPLKYGIGSGEIVGPERQTSRQSDLIIFDRMEGVSLVSSPDIQIFPVESIFGTIEVKSTLSKETLIDALTNIKSVKELAPSGKMSISPMPGMMVGYQKPVPFGIVFAYSLAKNSLDSLTQNLVDWEKDTSERFWPNLIVILNEGLIYHSGEMLTPYYNSLQFSRELRPTNFPWKEDTLLRFYIILLDLCKSMYLAPTQLNVYLDLPTRIGEYLVKHHDRWTKFDEKKGLEKPMQLTHTFIDRVVKWCRAAGKVSQRDLFLRQTGGIPVGASENFLNSMSYFYDPEKLPGMHQVDNPWITDDRGNMSASTRMLVPGSYFIADDETYYFPQAYLSESDIEENTE